MILTIIFRYILCNWQSSRLWSKTLIPAGCDDVIKRAVQFNYVFFSFVYHFPFEGSTFFQFKTVLYYLLLQITTFVSSFLSLLEWMLSVIGKQHPDPGTGAQIFCKELRRYLCYSTLLPTVFHGYCSFWSLHARSLVFSIIVKTALTFDVSSIFRDGHHCWIGLCV